MASVSLKEAMQLLTSDMTVCIMEMDNGKSSLFDKYERKRIHSYSLILNCLTKMRRDGHLDWDSEIEYY